MDLQLLQREAAELLGCSKAALLMWEMGRSSPEIRFWPRIVRFLRYDPSPEPQSIAELLLAARRLRGWSQKRLARSLGVDPTSVRRWELDRGRPEQYLGEKLVDLRAMVKRYRLAAGSPAAHRLRSQHSSGE